MLSQGLLQCIGGMARGRDMDGCCLAGVMSEVVKLDEEDTPAVEFEKGYPITTRIIGELIEHVNTLLQLFKSELPLMVPLRSTDAHKLRYIVTDASAEGFSIVTQYPELKLKGRDGMWTLAFARGGSNLR